MAELASLLACHTALGLNKILQTNLSDKVWQGLMLYFRPPTAVLKWNQMQARES
jgi:hypothetical protein